jgi:uncharacterized protein YdeI (YjbR/CyaY-like superfamily)
MDPSVDTSRMKREIHEMPPQVERALEERGVMAAYRARPAYQQNDYIWWITSAKRLETRQKRLEQMLDELEKGDVYMSMAWSGDSGRKRG